MRERQRSLPRGCVVEAWPDVFHPGVFWLSEATKRRLDGSGPPLPASAVVEGSRVPILLPDEGREAGSLPSPDSLRVRVVAGHGIAVMWYGSTAEGNTHPLPEPTSPEDAFFYLRKRGGRANHAWRLFRTREEAVEFIARHFPDDARARAWAAALPVGRYTDLVSRPTS